MKQTNLLNVLLRPIQRRTKTRFLVLSGAMLGLTGWLNFSLYQSSTQVVSLLAEEASTAIIHSDFTFLGDHIDRSIRSGHFTNIILLDADRRILKAYQPESGINALYGEIPVLLKERSVDEAFMAAGRPESEPKVSVIGFIRYRLNLDNALGTAGLYSAILIYMLFAYRRDIRSTKNAFEYELDNPIQTSIDFIRELANENYVGRLSLSRDTEISEFVSCLNMLAEKLQYSKTQVTSSHHVALRQAVTIDSLSVTAVAEAHELNRISRIASDLIRDLNHNLDSMNATMGLEYTSKLMDFLLQFSRIVDQRKASSKQIFAPSSASISATMSDIRSAIDTHFIEQLKRPCPVWLIEDSYHLADRVVSTDHNKLKRLVFVVVEILSELSALEFFRVSIRMLPIGPTSSSRIRFSLEIETSRIELTSLQLTYLNEYLDHLREVVYLSDFEYKEAVSTLRTYGDTLGAKCRFDLLDGTYTRFYTELFFSDGEGYTDALNGPSEIDKESPFSNLSIVLCMGNCTEAERAEVDKCKASFPIWFSVGFALPDVVEPNPSIYFIDCDDADRAIDLVAQIKVKHPDNDFRLCALFNHTVSDMHSLIFGDNDFTYVMKRPITVESFEKKVLEIHADLNGEAGAF